MSFRSKLALSMSLLILSLAAFAMEPFVIKDIKIELILIGSSFNDNIDLVSSYTGLRLYKYEYGVDGIIFNKKDCWFSDKVIIENYEYAILNKIDIPNRNSFTDNVIKLARGKI